MMMMIAKFLGRMAGWLLCLIGLHVYQPMRGVEGVTRCTRGCGAFSIGGMEL